MIGAGGLIGSHIRPLLRDRFDIRAVDVKPIDDEADSHVADITELEEVLPLTDGVDVVMHLAIASHRDFMGPERQDEFSDVQLDVNVKGTYHVLEAARRAEVKRVVVASTVMTMWGYPFGHYVALNDPPRPQGHYGATKYCAEVFAEMYAREHGLSIVCWRIGQPVDHANPNAMKHKQAHPPDRGVLVSFVDLANGFATAAEAEDVDFLTFPLVSDNADCYCDTAAARYVLGYEPVHRFTEEGVETLREWP